MEKAITRENFKSLLGLAENDEVIQFLSYVSNGMTHYLVDINPEKAEEYLLTLNAIRWKNYLTRKEADRIIERFQIDIHWDLKEFCDSVLSVNGRIDNEPIYNVYALWLTMNLIYLDSADTISSMLGDKADESLFVKAVYRLAVDKLKDRLFNVRSYLEL